MDDRLVGDGSGAGQFLLHVPRASIVCTSDIC